MTNELDAMEYDFINLGNHDFNYGEEVLQRHLDNMHAPLLTGNVLYKGKPLGLTYAVKELAGKKIVLFGVVTHYIPNWEKKQNIKQKYPIFLLLMQIVSKIK
jgi:2',3'-cyclic-nucleotide 2'-phosphodiesterase/3'-nucleotidase